MPPKVMEVKPRRYQGYAGIRKGLPWWAYILMLFGFYLLGWVLHLVGIIPSH